MNIKDLTPDGFENLENYDAEKIRGGVTFIVPRPIKKAVNNPGKDIPGLGPNTPSFKNSPRQPVQIPNNKGTRRAVGRGLTTISF